MVVDVGVGEPSLVLQSHNEDKHSHTLERPSYMHVGDCSTVNNTEVD